MNRSFACIFSGLVFLFSSSTPAHADSPSLDEIATALFAPEILAGPLTLPIKECTYQQALSSGQMALDLLCGPDFYIPAVTCECESVRNKACTPLGYGVSCQCSGTCTRIGSPPGTDS
jgi:hypothetical protein